MNIFRLQGLLVTIVAMIAAALAYAAIAQTLPYGITPATADAIGLSLVVVPIVFFGTLVTGQFPFREYHDDKGIDGILTDAAVILVVCLLATLLTAQMSQVVDVGGTARLLGIGVIGYFTAFGVFSARNLRYYAAAKASE
ncbi:hypothetical protein [Natranaeroarchaeum sulfidigenes]|uniref:Uncharacterized protein n=1 Tax=Natranaeroarchaeum sulfidigenes TaxID=2784880 RepID=A0A897MNS5_9EURY|nr:hypothetical protein [Natranaeroarchaeum sulfidigenes]QSG01588.1 hypothetical protein AArcS_0358 [Natranaeroarchaeum sulfidigenes]